MVNIINKFMILPEKVLMITIWMQVVSDHFDVTLTLTKCADLYIW